MNFVDERLKAPIVINPLLRGGNKGEITAVRNRLMVEKVSPATQVVPQIGVTRIDWPGEKTIRDRSKKK